MVGNHPLYFFPHQEVGDREEKKIQANIADKKMSKVALDDFLEKNDWSWTCSAEAPELEF